MAIITLEQLWEGFDRNVSVSPTIVKEQTAPFIDKRLFFNGLTTSQGVIRIYARFLSNHSARAAPVLIVLPPIDQNIDTLDPIKLLALAKHYALLIIDYGGLHKNKTYSSIYPKDIDTYWLSSSDTALSSPKNIKNSAHYYFTTSALFAITYLEQHHKELNIEPNKIGMLGINTGASILYKASIDNAIKCGATFFCGDIVGFLQDNIAYKVALDSRAYAKKTQLPVLISAATNEAGAGFDYLNDLYAANTNSRLSTFVLSSTAVSNGQRDNLIKWFDCVMQNSESNIPFRPKISSSVSEGINYIELGGEFESIEVFLAEDREAEYRNWKAVKHIKISETKYLARVQPSEFSQKIFANAKTKCGFNLSSEMIEIEPIKDEKPAIKRGRIVFKSGINDNGWLIKGQDFFDEDIPKAVKGPFDIDGVCAKSLVSLAVGDAASRGGAQSLLQIMLHVNKPIEVEFSLTTQNGKNKEYTHKKTIFERDWAFVTLSPQDFKCAKGVPSFDNVIAIGIKADTDVVVSSIIWV